MQQTILIIAAASAFGVVFYIGSKDLLRILRLARYGRRTEGHIVRDEVFGVNGGMFHYPVVQFKDETGYIHEFRSRHPRKSSIRDQMSPVTVAYNPANPKTEAEIMNRNHFYPSISGLLYFTLIIFVLTYMILMIE